METKIGLDTGEEALSIIKLFSRGREGEGEEAVHV